MLKVKNLKVGYGNVPVIFDLSFEVRQGEVVAIVGSNGAGKSTLLKTISGILRPSAGEILFCDKRIDNIPAYRIVEMGISHVPEGRQVFGKMSIKDNLMLGAYVLRSESEKAARLREVYELFPILRDRENQKAETLSGGEQQMLAIARGLMSNPRLLMVDEMSLGLAPFLVDRVMDTLKVIRNKVTVLLVEQKVQEALEIADRGYVLQNGRLAMEGSGAELLESDIVKKAYLGL
ncbi:MAG: ABC transporter ATP-binding protein [Clostridiales bacterium]|jgi:branched-chain amino acid transport system ATP-binding protein|nr:ABC transporter ATP-binding protein [Clostridiales bacterium]HOC08496.1 ABC transporter ATP-binding protein [Bacillota bacterium]HQA47511.1 ABC transporter ATP-binding protein [Bacillota bacterium]HZX46424.1 ABC transporter ATP-binding protein [Clostridia bacterium]